MKKSKKETQTEAVKAIISGELLLEEAMDKYNVKDKRTMLAWVKKTMPLLKASESASSSQRSKTLFDMPVETPLLRDTHSDLYHNDVLRENALLKKVINLQDKVRELEEMNGQLIKYRNFLMEKVSSLELKMQLKDKETR
ncbi:hypothetical protein FXV77_17645 [Sphingobacterium phlebotomi]|uniref:Uncharacterized protein n=1 Tax=Sphingobacterium phlebotomi TaxID=2605433 RepID=A0A5D4GXG7_9SPHI|nr:hypothetical protein [Sphingobacterium phlebotomi]TYR33286.1 hypothetical protein FXV77_17645 [Sphingobacterium phlebotomi]